MTAARALARIRALARCERGTAVDKLLLIGVIVLPLILFLIVYRQELVTWVTVRAVNVLVDPGPPEAEQFE